MMPLELTRAQRLAKLSSMQGNMRASRWVRGLVLATVGAAAMGGCVNVTAPDKPIVIELNVNIRQEVIYRLAADAERTIEENEDIF